MKAPIRQLNLASKKSRSGYFYNLAKQSPKLLVIFCVVAASTLGRARPAEAQAVVDNTTPGNFTAASTNSCNGGSFLVRSFVVNNSFPVGNVTLGLNVSHTFRGRIQGILQSPRGTQVRFLEIDTGDFNDNYDVLFRSIGGPINDGTNDATDSPSFDRSVRPSSLFGAFSGEVANGTWILALCDGGSDRTGRFNFSQLTISAISVSGFAFDDVNEDSVKDNGESTLGNISVSAYRDDGDGIYEPGAGDVLVGISETNFEGQYTFGGLSNGSYWIDVDETDDDLAGRSYGGSAETNTDDPRLVTYSGTAVANVDFPFVQDLNFLCEPGDPSGNLSFLSGATLESGADRQVGAVYRFSDVFEGVDALVEVAAFNNGATLAAIDNDTTGVLEAFQPTLSAVNGTTSSVDFNITMVEQDTTTPIALTFRASGVDIDGDGGTRREFIELTNLSGFKLSADTTLTASAIPLGNRFESNTTVSQPGVSATATNAVVVAEYISVSQLRYRIGAIGGTGASNQRLSSLYFGCTAGPPTASNPDVRLVKRITAINGQTTNPNDGTDLTATVNDGVADSSDDESNWPIDYLIGEINAGAIKPGDDIEYTIYFLNAGELNADDVRICDRLTPNQSLVTDAYGTDIDVELQLGTSAVLGLTAASDASDRTEFIAATDSVPANCNLQGANDDGTLVVDITGGSGTGDPALTTLPASTDPGTPNDAYGLFRFKTRIAP